MKREFVINRHGKDYVLYAGLLDEAHQQGLRSIKTELVQAPAAQNGNVAICVAEVTTDKGTFTGIGDADPSNVNRMMVNALIRLAETRAKARALRDAVNVAMVAIEELTESAPEMLLLDELAEAPTPSEAPRPASPAALTAAPASIVSLASVRRSVSGGSPPGIESNGTAAPAPAEPVPSSGGPAARLNSRTGSSGAGSTSGAGSAGKATSDSPPLPATPTQLETIAKLARSVGRTVSTEGLTRAAASEMITRLSEERYGARKAP